MKLTASIIDSHTINIIIDLTRDQFSDIAEKASVRSLFKNDCRSKLTNYIPDSFLNYLLKKYERSLHDKESSRSQFHTAVLME